MTPDPATVERVRKLIADAQARGLGWGDMRRNAHKAADSLGGDVAATITTAGDHKDGELTKLMARAETMRAEYAAFLDIWYADCTTTTPPKE